MPLIVNVPGKEAEIVPTFVKYMMPSKVQKPVSDNKLVLQFVRC